MRLRVGLIALGMLSIATASVAQPGTLPPAGQPQTAQAPTAQPPIGLPPIGQLSIAQTPVDHQAAQALQARLRTWFATLLGPTLPLPEPPLDIAADGNQYALTLPLHDLTGRKSDRITAALTMLDGSRWLVDRIMFPSAGAFSMPVPMGAGPSDNTDVTFTIGEQSSRILLDVDLASRSNWTGEYRDVELRMEGGGETQVQSFDRATMLMTLVPGADRRLDLQQEATLAGMEASTRTKDGVETSIEIRRVRQGFRLSGVNRDRLDQAWIAIKALIGTAKDPGTDTKPGHDPMRPHIQALIRSLRDFADRMEGEETFDDISIEIPGTATASLEQARFGFGVEAPAGKLHAWMDMALDGPSSQDLPPSLAKYMFTRLALRPAVAGVSTERLIQLLLDSTQDGADPVRLEADAAALFTEGGASIGLDALSIELADLRIEGSGRLRMLAPGQPGVEGRLSALGLEAVMQQAGKDPELQMVMPFLAIIRGLGRADGERMVWDLALTKDQAMVNGVDVMRMFDQPPTPPPSPPGGKRQDKRQDKR